VTSQKVPELHKLKKRERERERAREREGKENGQ
jgi:hypothetical protein